MEEPEAAEDVNWASSQLSNGAVGTPLTPYGLGGFSGAMSAAEIEAKHKEFRVQQAIQVLCAAKEVRANAPLMTEIREHIRAQRDRLGDLLDEI